MRFHWRAEHVTRERLQAASYGCGQDANSDEFSRAALASTRPGMASSDSERSVGLPRPDALLPSLQRSTPADGDEASLRPLPVAVLHLVLAATSARLLPIIATHSRSILVCVPCAHFATLALVAAVLPDRLPGGAPGSRRKLTRSTGSIGGDENADLRRLAVWTGALGAAALLLDLLVAETVNPMVGQALDVSPSFQHGRSATHLFKH